MKINGQRQVMEKCNNKMFSSTMVVSNISLKVVR